MGASSLFVLGLAITVVVLLSQALAGRIGMPEAILLVLLGTAAGFLPGVPETHLPPEIVLFGFLPPLVYHAAFFTAPREARADVVPITTLAVGLTLVTTFAAAAAAHWAMPALSWALAIAFGAAVAPTDAVSATAILQRLGAPLRLVTIVESESLINDGVALTAFGLAIEALTTNYTPGHVLVRTGEVAAGGVAYGLLVGFVLARVRRRIRDPRSQLVVSLLTPYLAYVPAERLGFSGVLATVTAGFYFGTRGEGMLQPATRVPGQLFWRMLVFLLESALFVLLGLQVRGIVGEVAGHTWSRVALAVLAVAAVIVSLRLLWVFLVFPLARFLPGRHLGFDHLPWRERVVIGWSGMRGAISLALVLSLPVSVHGHALAGRGELIFLAAAIVFVTLIGQATTLPLALRRFGLGEADRARMEQMRTHRAIIETALSRIDELAGRGEVDDRTARTFRQLYEDRLERVRAALDDEPEEEGLTDALMVRREILRAQRDRLRSLYRKGKIGMDTRRAVSRRLDLEDREVRRDVH
ncbi:Na+/H+ antiporter [Actinomadura sp. DC4]|uniref:Na+/H+ antiporter n=1 Tax=Actinomadura sp. DC4 TaxID=3055069 RepID=UPI0025AF114F|nr:Na+/H+ antiporter [Actinomadura sp. DC4]MDN3355815.1 Na+/H+ antiporter [Actinomadura sp. DC4]